MTIPGQPYGAPQQFSQPQFAQPQYGQPPAPQPTQAPQAYAQPGMPPQQPAPMGQFFTQQDPHIQAQQPAPQYPPAAAPGQPYAPQPAMSSQPTDTSSFFGGAASISFAADKGYVRGTFRGGLVLEKKIVPQTKMGTGEVIRWDDGTPREQMVLTLQTAERADPQDDGKRQIFIKGDAVRACREALSAVKSPDIDPGGWYYQAWVDEKPAKKQGYTNQKVYKSIYALPGSPDPLAGQHAPAPQPSAAPGPVAAMPQQAMMQAQQAVQYDPAMQAAVYGGQPAPGQAFIQAAAPEVAAMQGQNPVQQAYAQQMQVPPNTGGFPAQQQPQAYAQPGMPQQQQQFPQPGGQAGAGSFGAPPVQQPAAPASPSAAPGGGEWSPFAPA